MKVVVASDSFKGSLSSMGVATAAVRGVKAVCPDCEVVPVNIADGGEGLVEAVVEALGGEMVDVVVSDPLGRSISVCYGMAGKIAIIEMAAASGLPLLREEERNPWVTSTFGTGEMVMHAMRRGCRNFLVGLGGSATNDAGMGMLRAMGFRFYDVEGKEITDCCGGRLGDIRKVDVLEVADCVRQSTFVLACDVDIPFCGQDGAAYVFAPQKGADMDMVVQLDAGMASLARVIEETCCVDIVSVAGAGAAGGVGGGLYAFLNATLKHGIDIVLDAIDFDCMIRGADLVITGEGKLDDQTARGKTAAGVLARAKAQGIPVVAIGGRVEMSENVAKMGFTDIYPIVNDDVPLALAMRSDFAAANVEKTVEKIISQYLNTKH